MRKLFLILCISMLLTALPSMKAEDESLFVSLMDMAYPYGNIREDDKSELSKVLMMEWVDAVLPWEGKGILDNKEDNTGNSAQQMDPGIPVSKQIEIFNGIPEDHYVTVRKAAEVRDMAAIRAQFDQSLIYNYDRTVSLYNYDSDSMKLSPEFIDGEVFINKDLSLPEEIMEKSDKPVVLIFHTHAHEGYVDKEQFGILDVGDYLEEILENQYGISVLHHEAVYDEEGVNGAYTRMGEDIEALLKDNPSIQVAIDMHRDGVAEDTHLVTDINGKDTAQIMLVTGVSRAFDENGELREIEYLPNENLESVLALGFQTKMTSDVLYPGFMRPLYLSCWRYSTYMLPRSMLLEVGAQTNTLEEAKAAMEPFAELLVSLLTEKK